MKAILMSIKPQHVANILNGIKTLEIRKRFPSDYVGWVYIYVTKDRPYLTRGVRGDVYPSCVSSQGIVPHHLNSRVVARFWCDKVEKIEVLNYDNIYRSATIYCCDYIGQIDLLEKSCLSFDQIFDYLKDKGGYAIHITKLKTFDKPKEIKEFKQCKCFTCKEKMKACPLCFPKKPLTRAPQSWCYVEI